MKLDVFSLDKNTIIKIDGLSRSEARKHIILLKRKESYLVYILKKGINKNRKVYICTNGKKRALENGVKTKKIYDFTLHIEGEKEDINYLDDILIDLKLKEVCLPKNMHSAIYELIDALKMSIELYPLQEIYKKYPVMNRLESIDLPGHTVEELLVIIKWLGVQEDVNYWGINPNTKKSYEGRYKPYNAIRDYIVKKESLYKVLKKHRIIKK